MSVVRHFLFFQVGVQKGGDVREGSGKIGKIAFEPLDIHLIAKPSHLSLGISMGSDFDGFNGRFQSTFPIKK